MTNATIGESCKVTKFAQGYQFQCTLINNHEGSHVDPNGWRWNEYSEEPCLHKVVKSAYDYGSKCDECGIRMEFSVSEQKYIPSTKTPQFAVTHTVGKKEIQFKCYYCEKDLAVAGISQLGHFFCSWEHVHAYSVKLGSTTGKQIDPNGVNHPSHYNRHPSGVECIDIIKHHNFNIGSTIKYLWRQGLKAGEPNIKDLKKAAWYLQNEIETLEKQNEPSPKND
jgi:Protein of unknwon function (DUF3310)